MTAPSNADTTREVVALITAVLSGDEDLLFELIEQLDDKSAVLAGLCGFLADLLPQYAQAVGIEDLRAHWAEAATDAALRMGRGEPA